jgi:hypothetical protein
LTTEIVVGDTGIFYPGFSYKASHACNALFDFDRNGNPVRIIPIDSAKPSYTLFSQNVGDLRYDSKGNIIMSYSIMDTTFVFDTVLYTPTNTFKSFLIKANPSTRKIIWVREWKEDAYQQSSFANIGIDKYNNIYVNGQAGLNSVVNGDSIKFNSTAAVAMTAFFKLDSNGNTFWKIIADKGINGGGGIYQEPFTLYGENQICVPINVGQIIFWGGDTLRSIGTYPNNTSPWFLTFLNATSGKVEYADSLPQSNPLNNSIRKVITDEQGNIFFGGRFSAGLTVDSSHIYNIGGNNDAYVVKWGQNCSDSTALIAPLSAQGLIANPNGNAIDVTWQNISQYADKYRVYRSATDSLTGYALIDSVSSSTTHYTDVHASVNQAYWYKVSAVNHAGDAYSNADSASIRTVGLSEVTSIRHLSLYPNPTTNYTELSVWNDADKTLETKMTVTDMSGRQMYSRAITLSQGKNDFMLDVSGYGSGIFILNLNGNGGSYSRRLVVVK